MAWYKTVNKGCDGSFAGYETEKHALLFKSKAARGGAFWCKWRVAAKYCYNGVIWKTETKKNRLILAMSVEAALRMLNTNLQGLSDSEAAHRLLAYGKTRFRKPKNRILFGNFVVF